MPLFQPSLPPLPSDLSFYGKRIIVTGATAGLGLAATRQLLLHRANEVIMAVRNTAKGEQAREQILTDPDVVKANSSGKLTVMQLELENYESVMAFVQTIKSKVQSLDMLLLNAGVGSLKWETVSTTGHEKTMQVNLLSPALLALELLPLLEKTAATKGVPSRLTWVGSFIHFDHGLEKQPILASESLLSHFDDKTKFVPMSRYPDSKLMGTLFVSQLSKHVDPKFVIVNDVDPGMVHTGFGDYPVWFRALFTVILWLRGRSAEKGSTTYLHALALAGEDSHGAYLSHCHVAMRAPFVTTQPGRDTAQKLWEEIWVECLKVDSKLEHRN